MKYFFSFLIILISININYAMTKESPYDYVTTVKKIESFIDSKDLELFAKIDHSLAAAQYDLSLTPSVLLIFGSPKVGTTIMNGNLEWSLHLPLRVAIFNNKSGKTMIKVPNLENLEKTDKLPAPQKEALKKMSALLKAILEIK